MPAEHSGLNSVVYPKDIVFKHNNKSLKRRPLDRDGPFSQHNAYKSHPPRGFSPCKRRRVEVKGEERSLHGRRNVVHTRNRRRDARFAPTQLNRILGIHPKPELHRPRASSDPHKAELQQRIKALQHILQLADQPSPSPSCPSPVPSPVPSPSSPSTVCTATHRWTVAINLEKDGQTETLAEASLDVKNGMFGIPNSLLPTHLTIRETVHKCVWRYLKTDLSVIQLNVDFKGTEAGKAFCSGLWKTRKSAVLSLPNNFELHLVPQSTTVSDDEPLLGYLCPSLHPWKLAESNASSLSLSPSLISSTSSSSSSSSPSSPSGKLAAAIDIDDTLVRLIPAADRHKYPAERIRTLPMFGESPDWVLALSTHVETFLASASQHFHLALYSVGVPEYVAQVAAALDPTKKYLDWGLLTEGLSSARFEHDNGDTSPKHFAKLFSWTNRAGGEPDLRGCVGVDDSCGAWAQACRDRVIDPQPHVVDGVWDSRLLVALEKMREVYNAFHAECNSK